MNSLGSTRLRFLIVTGLATVSVAVEVGTGGSRLFAGEPVSDKPNIVFIMADDLGYGDFGCYGATKIKTPNVDRLAREGMRFTDAHTPDAMCSPTRYGVLTGRYCWRTRLKKGTIGTTAPLLIDTNRMTVASSTPSQYHPRESRTRWITRKQILPKSPGIL